MKRKKFSILEIRNYISSQQSIEKLLENLSEENIIKAQPKLIFETDNTLEYFVIYDSECNQRIEGFVNFEYLNEKQISKLLEIAFGPYFSNEIDPDSLFIKCQEGICEIKKEHLNYTYCFLENL